MTIEIDLQILFLLTGLFQSIVIIAVSFFQKQSKSNKLFASTLCILSLLIYNNVVFYGAFSSDKVSIADFVIPEPILLLGPLLYFYCRSLFEADFRINKSSYWHFLPAILDLLSPAYVLAVLALSLDKVNHYPFLNTYDDFIVIPQFTSLTIYLVYTWLYLFKVKSLADHKTFKWARDFILGISIINIIWLPFLLLYISPYQGQLLNRLYFHPIFYPMSGFFYFLSYRIMKVGLSFRPNRAYKEMKNFFPLSVIVLNDKFYATQSLENSIDAGNEILSINDLPTDSLIQVFKESHWTEGLRHTAANYQIGRYFNCYAYPIFIGNANKYIVQYIDSEGGKRKDVLEKDEKRSSPIVNYVFSDNLDLSFHSVHGVSTAIMDINAFFDWEKNGKTYKFSKELRSAFKRIDSAKSENLIIDLRDNGGGRAPYELFSYLHDSSFTFFDRMEFIVEEESKYSSYCEPKLSKLWITSQSKKMNLINDSTYNLKREPMLKVKKPSKPQYEGNLYVLINGGSGSAASDLAALLKSHNLASFIGTETGGGYYGNTSMEDAWITLPNTKVRVKIPLVRHFLPVEDKVPLGRGVIPDHEVEQSIVDLTNGVDTQMEFAFTILKEKHQ